MPEFQIRTETLPVRCEICHQTDAFDPQTNRCQRCLKVSTNQRLRLRNRLHGLWQRLPEPRLTNLFLAGGAFCGSPIAAVVTFHLLFTFEPEVATPFKGFFFLGIIGLWVILTIGVARTCAGYVHIIFRRLAPVKKEYPPSLTTGWHWSHLLGIGLVSLFLTCYAVNTFFSLRNLWFEMRVRNSGHFKELQAAGWVLESPTELDDLLVKASETGSMGSTVILLGFNVSAQSKTKALTAAVRTGNISMVKLLLIKGATVSNVCRPDSVTVSALQPYYCPCASQTHLLNWYCLDHHPLALAAQNGRLEIVKLLLDQTTNPTFREAAMVAAFKAKQYQTADFLMGHNVSPDGHGIDYETALTTVAQNGDLEMVKYLLSKGASLNGYNCKGETALVRALQNGHLEVARYLIEAGAPVNLEELTDNGHSPLEVAIETGRTEMVQLLFQHGAMLEKDYQPSILLRAIEQGNLPMVRLLFDHKLNIHSAPVGRFTAPLATLLSQKNRDPSLMKAALWSGNLEIVHFLEQQGISVKNDGPGMLPLVVQQDNYEMAKLMLERGVSAEDQNPFSPRERPLEIAISHHQVAMVKLLLAHKADINQLPPEPGGDTLFHAVAYAHYSVDKQARYEIFRLLLSQVKNLNQTNKDGHTPLLCLICSIPEWEQIDYDTVQLLLDKGAEVNVKGTDGLTALGYAEGCGNQKLVRMLKKAGAR